MPYLYFGVLLVLAGGIHGTPVTPNFSFEVNSSMEMIHRPFSSNAVINCNTNDASAIVTLEKLHPQKPTNVPVEEGKITRNGSVFTIHNIIVHDGGKYQCVAEKNGQVIKREILLIIDTSKPKIAIIPFKSKRILTGSNFYYTCEATKGSIEWFKDEPVPLRLPAASLKGVVVQESIGVDNIVRKDLAFKNVDGSHSGNYRCELTFRGKTSEKIVQVLVKDPAPAEIEGYSSSPLTVDPNQAKVEITCRVTGFPEPVVTWRKDGKVIGDCAGQRDCRYVKQHDGLQIRQPRHPDDDAVFSCEARNKYGIDSKTFTVVVPAPPVLDRSVQTVFTFADFQSDPVYIRCVLLEGSPEPTFEWSYQLCVPLQKLTCYPWTDIGNRPAFRAMNSNSQSTLRISPSHLPPQLNFRCRATNDEGSDEMTFELRKRARYY